MKTSVPLPAVTAMTSRCQPPSASDEARVYFDCTSPSGGGWSGGGVTLGQATGNAVLPLADQAELERIQAQLDGQQAGLNLDEWARQADGGTPADTPVTLPELVAALTGASRDLAVEGSRAKFSACRPVRRCRAARRVTGPAVEGSRARSWACRPGHGRQAGASSSQARRKAAKASISAGLNWRASRGPRARPSPCSPLSEPP